jgi:hypothetical protein
MTDSNEAEAIVINLPPQEKMLQAVGRGIQAFACVELGLSFMFASLMEPAPRELSVIALDAAGQVRTKLLIVESVAQKRLIGNHRDEACKLLNRIRKRSEIRNRLAHWTVSHWPGASSVEQIRRMKVALIPPPASVKHGPVVWTPETSQVRPLFQGDSERFAKLCDELFHDLVTFSNEIAPTSD